MGRTQPSNARSIMLLKSKMKNSARRGESSANRAIRHGITVHGHRNGEIP